MAGLEGGTQGPPGNPSEPIPPTPHSEWRRVTRGMCGVSKRKRLESDVAEAETIETVDREFSGNNDGSTTSLGELTGLIAALKDIINRQSHTIESIRSDLTEVKTQNGKLQEEVKTIRLQLEAYSVSPPTTRSWASVVAGSNNSSSGYGSTLSRPASSETSTKETSCVRISTRPQNAEAEIEGPVFTRYMSTDSANAQIRNALLNADATKDVQVVGVGTTKTGYIIRFADELSATIARNNGDWLQELGNGTKLVKPRFGVVVHRTPTEMVTIQEGKDESIQKIMEENHLVPKGFHIEDIAWLIRKEKLLGRSASLGIWFDTKEGAEWAINNGLVFGQKYIGSIEAYQVKKKRCHRCQHFGQLVWSCRQPSRCGHCAGDHEQRNCPPGSAAKCLDCEGQHPTGDKQCKGPSPGTSSQ